MTNTNIRDENIFFKSCSSRLWLWPTRHSFQQGDF